MKSLVSHDLSPKARDTHNYFVRLAWNIRERAREQVVALTPTAHPLAFFIALAGASSTVQDNG